jgi:hypothetical protein
VGGSGREPFVWIVAVVAGPGATTGEAAGPEEVTLACCMCKERKIMGEEIIDATKCVQSDRIPRMIRDIRDILISNAIRGIQCN